MLERLRHDTGETVCLFRRQGVERVAIAVVNSSQDLRFSIEVGHRRPLWRGAPGHVLLAQLPDRDLNASLRIVPADARRMVLAECRQVRKAGYAVSHGEIVVGGTAVAAPVESFDSEPLALAVFGPSARLTNSAVEKVVRVIRLAAREISQRRGISGNLKEPGQ